MHFLWSEIKKRGKLNIWTTNQKSGELEVVVHAWRNSSADVSSPFVGSRLLFLPEVLELASHFFYFQARTVLCRDFHISPTVEHVSTHQQPRRQQASRTRRLYSPVHAQTHVNWQEQSARSITKCLYLALLYPRFAFMLKEENLSPPILITVSG